VPKNDKAEKFQTELKVLHKRSMDHQKRYTGGFAENRRLMYGRGSNVSQITSQNGIAEAYGLFRSLVSNTLFTSPDTHFETTKEEATPIAQFLGDVVSWDFKIGGYHSCLVKALWQNFPYGYGAIVEDMETKFLGKDEDRFVDRQRYFWKNHPWRDIAFDADGFNIDLSDHRLLWLAYYKSIHDIRTAKSNDGKEKLYFDVDNIDEFPNANPMTNTERNKYLNSDSAGNPVANAYGDIPPKFRQLKIWRCYDRVNACIVDILDHDKRMILYEDWPVPIKIQGLLQFPARVLAMNTEADEFYPTPEIELIKPQIKNLVKLNDQLMTDLTVKIRKYVGLAPYLDQAKMGKLLDPKTPNTFIVTTNSDSLQAQANIPKVDSAMDVVHKVPDIEPSQQLVPGMQEIRGQIQRISAYGEANRGGLPAIRSAKEAARVSDAVQKSLMGRQSELEKFAAGSATYHVLLLKETCPPDSERYVRITDKLSAVGIWKKFSPKDIPSEEDLFCFPYVGSSTPQTLDSKKAQFLQEMQIIAPILEKSQLSLLPLLYRYAEIFSVKHIDQLLKNQKGAAMMAQATLVRAGQLGSKAPPDMILKPMMDLIDAILSPSEKQMVIEAAKGSATASGQQTPPSPDGTSSFKKTGNSPGAVDMGSPS
jgi:hypothetical protein